MLWLMVLFGLPLLMILVRSLGSFWVVSWSFAQSRARCPLSLGCAPPPLVLESLAVVPGGVVSDDSLDVAVEVCGFFPVPRSKPMNFFRGLDPLPSFLLSLSSPDPVTIQQCVSPTSKKTPVQLRKFNTVTTGPTSKKSINSTLVSTPVIQVPS